MKQYTKGAFLTMFGAACWGVSGCMGQYLFTHEGMSATWLVPIRLFLAGILLAVYCIIKNRKQFFAPWDLKHNPRYALDLIIYGLAGVSCCQFLYFLTIQLSSAGTATILQNISPVLILLVVCLTGKRAPKPFEVGSILLALIGLFLLTTHGSLTALAISPTALLSGLASAVCVVIYTMWPKKLQAQFPTTVMQGWAFLMGGSVFLLVFRPWQSAYIPSPVGILGIAVVVLVGNVLAFCCFMSGVKLVGAQAASLYSFAEPLTAAVISTLVLGTSYTVWDALGFACIFAMLALLSRSEPQAAQSTAPQTTS